MFLFTVVNKMNELDLISEVEKRPILYDRSVSGFNKTKLRDDAWKEVHDALEVTEMECKKRWRSLRDSFIKLQRSHGGRTRWPYMQAMSFLLPHIDAGAGHGKQEADSARREQEEIIPLKRSEPSYDSDPEEYRQKSLPDLSYAVCEAARNLSNQSEDDGSSSSSGPMSKKARADSTEDEVSCTCRTDPDELFFLSCAPALKRLSAKDNAVARIKIQQTLYEMEFGQTNIQYETPSASECSFEPIETPDYK